MAFGVTDLKKGVIFQLENVPYKVIDYSQKVLGRGGSIVNVKIKDLVDGKVLNKTFKGNERLEPADVLNINVRFLYVAGSSLFFMNDENFEQYELPAAILGEQKNYLVEGSSAQAQQFGGRIINVELPKNVLLKVEHAEDAVKGDTSSALTKNATLETGARVRVPAFIKTDDTISIDTSTGAYRERKKG